LGKDFNNAVEEKARMIPYPGETLRAAYARREYVGADLAEIAFPIGGIGTGCISITGKGELVDWEIFNRPNKSYRPRHTFFSIVANEAGAEPVFRILEGRLSPAHSRHLTRYDISGAAPSLGFTAGLPRMESTTFWSEFPFCNVRYCDSKLPVQVELEAFNPFIPGNELDSSLPVAMFLVHVTNPKSTRCDACVAFSMENISSHGNGAPTLSEFRREGGIQGVWMKSLCEDARDEDRPSLAVGSPWPGVTYQVPWYRGEWWDHIEHFRSTFCQNGRFDDNCDVSPSRSNQSDIISLGWKLSLGPGETVSVPVALAWYVPVFSCYWNEEFWHDSEGEATAADCTDRTRPQTVAWRNYYATQFKDAWHVLEYALGKRRDLLHESDLFRKTFYSSSLPGHVVELVGNNLAILKSPTCLRLEDGTLYAFEGCCGDHGSCVGSCSHVWNYAQSLAYLFPGLERGMREAELKYSVRQSDGHMRFRIQVPLGRKTGHGFHAAADGQFGEILRLYREWANSGDSKWLAELWPSARRALEYAWLDWDPDRDGILDGVHHNTYDIEFHGAEPLANFLYLAALKAAEVMALEVGDESASREYSAVFDRGAKRVDDLLFNGEFYVQRQANAAEPKYQFGNGCLSDQLIGQWYADMLQLGDLARSENLRRALESIFRYNWKTDFTEFMNPQRVFVMNDEKGLVLCSWPKGGRPEFPFPYSDEVWYGIEYHVASCMIMRGLVDEGLAIAMGIRDRHAGWNRNPWNEVECGNHYARSLSSYGLWLALSGIRYVAAQRHLSIRPVPLTDDFRCFYSFGPAWGAVELQRGPDGGCRATIQVLSGALDLERITLPAEWGSAVRVTAPGADTCTAERLAPGVIVLGKSLTVRLGEELVLESVSNEMAFSAAAEGKQ
jgi:non-lysosomal glucosylceramidase